jgi:hypothetical protein
MAKQFNPPPKQVNVNTKAVTLPTGFIPYNPYANVPPGWNPSLPPPTIQPTKGLPIQPEAYQYPGAVYGANWIDVQELIRKQKKSLGILQSVANNTTASIQIKLSGTAKILLGLKISNNPGTKSPNSKLTLLVNNERIINDASVFFFLSDFSQNSMTSEFVSVPRPISGNDDISLQISEVSGLTQLYEITFYYL